MSLIKWTPMLDPFRDFDKFFEGFGGKMGSWQGGFMPAVDVYQDDKSVTVETPLPGVDPNKVNVAVENDTLTIEGKTEKQSEVDEKNYYRKEVSYGSFHRVVPLPSAVDGAKAQATYDNGILKVIVPKEERAQPKKIKVVAKGK